MSIAICILREDRALRAHSTLCPAFDETIAQSEPRKLASVVLVLTIHAKGGKRPDDQAVRGNRPETIDADAVLAVVNSRQRLFDLLKLAGDIALHSALNHGVVY